MLSKRLKIAELPDELHDFLMEVLITDQALVWFVAKEGQANDFAVYMGQADIEFYKRDVRLDFENMQQLRTNTLYGTLIYGTKVFEYVARELFPEYNDLDYRS